MATEIPVKKRKLKHNAAAASSGVVKQPSAALSPITNVQGNGNVGQVSVGKIFGKPLAYLNDRRLA